MYRYDLNLKLLLETPEALLQDFTPDKKRAEEILRTASKEKRVVLNFYEVREIMLAYAFLSSQPYGRRGGRCREGCR